MFSSAVRVSGDRTRTRGWRTMIRRFLKERSGATAIEYALIAMLISVATIGGIKAVGEANEANMNKVVAKMPASS